MGHEKDAVRYGTAPQKEKEGLHTNFATSQRGVSLLLEETVKWAKAPRAPFLLHTHHSPPLSKYRLLWRRLGWKVVALRVWVAKRIAGDEWPDGGW